MWRSRAVGCTCWRGDRPAWRKSGRLAVRLEPMIILELPPDKGNSPPRISRAWHSHRGTRKMASKMEPWPDRDKLKLSSKHCEF